MADSFLDSVVAAAETAAEERAVGATVDTPATDAAHAGAPSPGYFDDLMGTPEATAPETPTAETEAPAAEATAETPEATDDAPATDAAPEPAAAEEVPLPDVLRPVADALGIYAEGVDTVVEAVAAIRDELDGYRGLQSLISGNADFVAVVQALVAGQTLADAVLANVPGLIAERPDPEDDPEGYARYVERQAEEKAARKAQESEQKRAESIARRSQEDLDRIFDGFVRRHGMSDDEARAFADTYGMLVAGDAATGRRRSDMFDVVRNGLRFDEAVAKAREEGRIEGKNEALKTVQRVQKGGAGDAVPLVTGGGSGRASAPAGSEASRLIAPSHSRSYDL